MKARVSRKHLIIFIMIVNFFVLGEASEIDAFLLDKFHIPNPKNFAVANDAQVLLIKESGENRVLFPNRKSLLSEVSINSEIADVLIDDEDGIFVIHGDFLSYVSEGKTKKMVQLPARNMKLAGDNKEYIYVYGGNEETDKTIYLFSYSLGCLKLITLNDEIQAVTAHDDLIFIAAGSIVYQLELNSSISVYCQFFGKQIKSLAYDQKSETLYISLKNGIYCINSDGVQLLYYGFGGTLKFKKKYLYVLNKANTVLYRVKKR